MLTRCKRAAAPLPFFTLPPIIPLNQLEWDLFKGLPRRLRLLKRAEMAPENIQEEQNSV